MKCAVCDQDTGDYNHDRCRSHAPCSRQGRYDSAPCSTCQEVWRRARNTSNPSDTITAVQMLEDWIGGFCLDPSQSKLCWNFLCICDFGFHFLSFVLLVNFSSANFFNAFRVDGCISLDLPWPAGRIPGTKGFGSQFPPHPSPRSVSHGKNYCLTSYVCLTFFIRFALAIFCPLCLFLIRRFFFFISP